VAITHDQTFTNTNLIAKTPFVKPPIQIDYGSRLKVGGSTFINRGCMILDTPVADVVIGERCNIGPNCCIISVTRMLTPCSFFFPFQLPSTLDDARLTTPFLGWVGGVVGSVSSVPVSRGAFPAPWMKDSCLTQCCRCSPIGIEGMANKVIFSVQTRSALTDESPE